LHSQFTTQRHTHELCTTSNELPRRANHGGESCDALAQRFLKAKGWSVELAYSMLKQVAMLPLPLPLPLLLPLPLPLRLLLLLAARDAWSGCAVARQPQPQASASHAPCKVLPPPVTTLNPCMFQNLFRSLLAAFSPLFPRAWPSA
jgi:hypothetical protein